MLIPNADLGKNIAHYRKKQKLTQKELAAITGIRLKHISDIETGKRINIYTFARLAAKPWRDGRKVKRCAAPKLSYSNSPSSKL